MNIDRYRWRLAATVRLDENGLIAGWHHYRVSPSVARLLAALDEGLQLYDATVRVGVDRIAGERIVRELESRGLLRPIWLAAHLPHRLAVPVGLMLATAVTSGIVAGILGLLRGPDVRASAVFWALMPIALVLLSILHEVAHLACFLCLGGQDGQVIIGPGYPPFRVELIGFSSLSRLRQACVTLAGVLFESGVVGWAMVGLNKDVPAAGSVAVVGLCMIVADSVLPGSDGWQAIEVFLQRRKGSSCKEVGEMARIDLM